MDIDMSTYTCSLDPLRCFLFVCPGRQQTKLHRAARVPLVLLIDTPYPLSQDSNWNPLGGCIDRPYSGKPLRFFHQKSKSYMRPVDNQ